MDAPDRPSAHRRGADAVTADTMAGMARTPKPVPEPTVTFWGAARTVTGSMHRLDACNRTILLDCGLFQGPRAEAHRRNRDFPFRAKDIDAVVLSHAHID